MIIFGNPPECHVTVPRGCWALFSGKGSTAGVFRKKEYEVVNLDLDQNNSIDTIGYYQPKMWFIENTPTGLLKSRDFMQP